MKVAITPLYGIGDTLLITPMIRALKEGYRGIEITVFTLFKTTRDVLEGNPYIDELIYFPALKAGKFATFKFLSKFWLRFDGVIIPFPSNRREYNLFALTLIPKKFIIGHRYIEKAGFLSFDFVKTWKIKEDPKLHVVQENLKLLKYFKIDDPPAYPLQIYLTDEEIERGEDYIKSFKDVLRIGIHAGTSAFKNHTKRRWPISYFIELAKKINEHFNNDVVFFLFGGPEELPLKREIKQGIEGSARAIIIDTPSIRETISIMKFMNFFISNDSGLMHIAAALQLPVLAIFGPTNPVWVRPWKTVHKIARIDLKCSPCFTYSPKPLVCKAGLDFKCLRDLSPLKVFNLFMELYNEIKLKKEGIKA